VRHARRLQAQSHIIGLHGSVGGHAAKAVEEHEAIYQAIRAGDPQAAALAAATHIDNTLDDYRREIQQRLFPHRLTSPRDPPTRPTGGRPVHRCGGRDLNCYVNLNAALDSHGFGR
jgi:hypothetical protein